MPVGGCRTAECGNGAQRGKGEWRQGLSHCGLNLKQSEVRSKATFVKQKCKEQTVQEGSGKQRQPATGLKTKKARKKGYQAYAEC